jgi:hypothetical protein
MTRCAIAFCCLFSLGMVSTAQAASLPLLGDGQVTSKTYGQKGKLRLCGALGAQAANTRLPWIYPQRGVWSPRLKPQVIGAVAWNQASFRLGSGRVRSFQGNGLPTKGKTGRYPVASADLAFRYTTEAAGIASHST